MAKPYKAPTVEDEQHLRALAELHRAVDVKWRGGAVELVPRPGYHVTTTYRVMPAGRAVHVLIGPVAKE